MELFDKISDTIMSAGKEVTQKAKDVSEIAKLQREQREKENFVNKKFTEIGQNYYEEHKDDENEDFAEIKAALDRIEELKGQVEDLKGAKVCPTCGAKIDEKAAFCSNCGSKIANDEIEVVSEEELEEE